VLPSFTVSEHDSLVVLSEENIKRSVSMDPATFRRC
jgi:hypothetical protein